MSVFNEYFVDTLKNRYAKFDGRARRSEYWYFQLFYMIFLIGILFVSILMVGGIERLDEGNGFALLPFSLLIIFFLGMFIPSLALSVRRLHDTGKSGWWLLLSIIPLVSSIGWIVLLVFYCLEGEHRSNIYGPNPKALGLDKNSASDHLITYVD